MGVMELIAVSAIAAILVVVALSERSKRRAAESKLAPFDGLEDVEAVAAAARADAETAEARRSEAEAATCSLHDQIRSLEAERAAVEADLELQSFGFYVQHYDLPDASAYKDRLSRIRADQKSLVKSEGAASCDADWSVEGSKAKGRKMVKEQMKLMLRAFNGECDAAVASVRYNNVVSLEKRIERSFDAINRLGRSKQVYIEGEYLALKLAELRLVHEHREKVQEEREEQRRIREQMKEEQRATKELEKAQADAEREEAKQVTALEKARRDLEDSVGTQHERLATLVARLEAELAQTLERKAKAVARAQLTRSGHVYIISNVGSFGEDVYKIGMTRRLEPLERVKELGDASVPFQFDVHAMVYAEDAPSLESALHAEFDSRRVNRVNRRKEYFRVSLEEIRSAVGRHHGIVTFVTTAAAEEYRKSLAYEARRVTGDAASAS